MRGGLGKGYTLPGVHNNKSSFVTEPVLSTPRT